MPHRRLLPTGSGKWWFADSADNHTVAWLAPDARESRTRSLAITNRSRISSAHKVTTVNFQGEVHG